MTDETAEKVSKHAVACSTLAVVMTSIALIILFVLAVDLRAHLNIKLLAWPIQVVLFNH